MSTARPAAMGMPAATVGSGSDIGSGSRLAVERGPGRRPIVLAKYSQPGAATPRLLDMSRMSVHDARRLAADLSAAADAYEFPRLLPAEGEDASSAPPIPAVSPPAATSKSRAPSA